MGPPLDHLVSLTSRFLSHQSPNSRFSWLIDRASSDKSAVAFRPFLGLIDFVVGPILGVSSVLIFCHMP